MKASIQNNIENAIQEKIISHKTVLGGCINDSEIIKTQSGKSFFVKTNNNFTDDMFLCEANGLNELSKVKVIRVPEVIFVAEEFLVLENILQNSKSKTFWEDFGRAFAKLHKYSNKTFGFYEDNYIGSTPQLNVISESESINWIEFYFNQRLLVQFQLAENNGFAQIQLRNAFLQLENKFDSIFTDINIIPSLLHGDLWSGNFITDELGNACLIDPAVYYGHREADLAMTKLFGGFDNKFYDSYNEEFPLDDGYEYRENIYKLYHVLNHLNLFGSGYYQQAVNLIEYYL